MSFLSKEDFEVYGTERAYSQFLRLLLDRGFVETEEGTPIQDLYDEARGLSLDAFWKDRTWDDLTFVVKKQDLRTHVFFIPIEDASTKIMVKTVQDLFKRADLNEFPRHVILVAEAVLGSPTVQKLATFSTNRHRVEYISYEALRIEAPRHYMTDPHQTLTKEEAEVVYRSVHADPKNFPILSIKDPLVRWYGWAPGTLVKFTSNRQHMGKSVYYRVIVANDYKNAPVSSGEWYL